MSLLRPSQCTLSWLRRLVFLSLPVALAGLAGYFYTLVLFGPLDGGAWVGLNAAMWLEMVVFVALTLLFSTLLRSQAAAAGLCFGGILLVNLIATFPGLGQAMPPKLTEWGASLLTAQPITAWPAFFVGLGLIFASLLAAWIIFERQEL